MITTRRTRSRILASLASFLMLTGVLVAMSPEPAAAISGADFNPAYIISDQNFYNRYAMTQAEIQSFLDSKIGACGNTNCLNVKTTTSITRPADAICGQYTGATNELTSAIIFKVQQACGISAKVILVTLQKEQGLITNRAPTDAKLARAMGYACPDSSGGTCDSLYSGLYNQIYWAGRQYVRYSVSGTFTWYPVGRASNILFHPNAAMCGSGSVVIQNKATAALYYYTPYQPNAAALANLGGTGDACSSYGNRNFWVYYNSWFGSPTAPPGSPYGEITVATGTPAGIQISGWAVQPSAITSTVHLAVNISGKWISYEADQPDTLADAAFPGAGSNHGFSALVAAPSGPQTFCLWASGPSGAVVIGCRTVTVPVAPQPMGDITSVEGVVGGIALAGWAVQPALPTSTVHLAVNVAGRWLPYEADQPNPLGEAALPGAGPNHGFTALVPLAPGSYSFCLWASGVVKAVVIECASAVVPASPPPKGDVTGVTSSPTGFTLTGWSVLPGSPSTSVHLAVNIDGRWIPADATLPSAEAAAAYPGIGPNHGFSITVPAAVGTRSYCLWASGTVGAVILECGTAVVAAVPPPVGVIESATGVAGGIQFSGWAVLPSAQSTPVHLAVNIGSRWISYEANQPSSTATVAYPAAGPNHGFSGFIPASPGSQGFCLWASGITSAYVIECRTVVVPS